MNVHHFKRLKHGGITLVVLAAVSWLVIDAVDEGLNLYVTPSSIAKEGTQQVYLGGQVVAGSVEFDESGYHFQIEDDQAQVNVHYSGALPPMFQAGREAVVVGRLVEGEFVAGKVLAKHDEYYKPMVE